MKLLILGAGHCQVNAIVKAKKKGHTVIVSDYYENPPGKKFCDYKELASTFDIEGNIQVAKKYDIDGILTLGTDQPVYTAAEVAEKLNLPGFLDTVTAKKVTNKREMKKLFRENSIPTVNFTLLKKDFDNDELTDIKFPVVIKPLDSQGQRGVYKLNSTDEIRNHFEEVLSYSREEEILVEEYYQNGEITVTGWVENDNVYILTVTDRVTHDNLPHIGICTAHNFPSKYLKAYFNEINEITEKIVHCFKIHNGPIYFQMLVGREGLKVNEIACRLGGAYEDEFIPLLTGVDILNMLIESSLGNEVDYTKLKNYNLADNNKLLSIQLLFAKPGKIKSLGDMEEIKKLPGVHEAKFNFKSGHVIGEMTNATERVGYVIIQGDTVEELNENVDSVFNNLKILDENDNNLIINFKENNLF